MQTYPLQLARPLKNARIIPCTASKLPADSVLSQPDANKLTATSLSEPVNVPAQAHEVRELLANIEQQIRDSGTTSQLMMNDFQELSIKLAIQIASAIVRYEVSTDVSRIRKLIESVRSELSETEAITVRLNKIDLEQLQQLDPDLLSADSLLQLKPDDSIVVGDCRIESEQQVVVANYARQIDEIQQQLMESLHDARLERKHSDTNHPGS